MLSTFAPSAVTPPSAKANACVATTTAITTQATHGPSSTAASVAPRKCPLVPPATGKFSICAAKTNAATTPSNGIRDSSSERSARRSPHPTAATAGTAAASATSPERNPSGMCIASGTARFSFAGVCGRPYAARAPWGKARGRHPGRRHGGLPVGDPAVVRRHALADEHPQAGGLQALGGGVEQDAVLEHAAGEDGRVEAAPGRGGGERAR